MEILAGGVNQSDTVFLVWPFMCTPLVRIKLDANLQGLTSYVDATLTNTSVPGKNSSIK